MQVPTADVGTYMQLQRSRILKNRGTEWNISEMVQDRELVSTED